ncbi:CLUMA_CG011209, isoform A [Clunio marinus]|uniref:CLUMA_CG011209, isoform A n=1 Tax=Clunio marinus TaxID=568069 RepID=A0A1J1IHB5_9DIPT|nr:CLUMA_CG011209, isoform A [Clunio marinus]
MEDAPLNNAHFYARKAESLLKLNSAEKFNSINYLEKCIECLDHALSQTQSPKAIESLKLQKNHHIKQRDLILHHYEKYKKNEQKLETTNVPFNERVINSNKIQLDLFENIDNTDTLLEELQKIHPDLQPAIELQQVNSQLNVLLYQLITQFDETIQENDILKEKIKALETEKRTKVEKKTDCSLDERHDELRLSPDAIEAHEEFAPLDLPEFDLGTLDVPKL